MAIDPSPVGALQFRVEARIRYCGLDLWQRMTEGGPLFISAPFLHAFEEALPESLQLRYGALSDSGVPVAVLLGQIPLEHLDFTIDMRGRTLGNASGGNRENVS